MKRSAASRFSGSAEDRDAGDVIRAPAWPASVKWFAAGKSGSAAEEAVEVVVVDQPDVELAIAHRLDLGGVLGVLAHAVGDHVAQPLLGDVVAVNLAHRGDEGLEGGPLAGAQPTRPSHSGSVSSKIEVGGLGTRSGEITSTRARPEVPTQRPRRRGSRRRRGRAAHSAGRRAHRHRRVRRARRRPARSRYRRGCACPLRGSRRRAVRCRRSGPSRGCRCRPRIAPAARRSGSRCGPSRR